MSQNEFEMGNTSSPSQGRPPTPKTPTNNEPTVHDSPRSSMTVHELRATVMPSHSFPAFVFLLYATLALLSWILLCVMSKRPIIGEKTYYTTTYSDGDGRFAINERYYRTARILQSIVSLLTIPVTSTICSVACVAYMQTGRLRKSLTLRQTMALADQGWISPRIWTRLGSMGSLPLYVAFGLTLVGCVFQLLQSALVEQQSILAGSSNDSVVTFADTVSLIQSRSYNGETYNIDNDGYLVHQLRGLMETTDKNDYDPHLWGGYRRSGMQPIQSTVSRWITKDDSRYVVPLPMGFNSGAYPLPQYAPRLNSSLQYTNVSQAEWTRECRNETDNGGFYALFEHRDEYDHDTVFEACMTHDIRKTPWLPARDRQDITETLWLRISAVNVNGMGDLTGGGYFKAEVKTTLGYFEVPSQSNGNRPGPLLDKDPIPKTSEPSYYSRSRREANSSYAGNENLMTTDGKGPLTSLTLALFGPGSFVASRLSNASAFVIDRPRDEDGYSIVSGNCVTIMPLSNFLSISSCITDWDAVGEARIISKVRQFLSEFLVDEYSNIDDSLKAGLFMANKVWLRQGSRSSGSSGLSTLAIRYDDGIPTIKPKISTTWLILGSILLGMHLLGLLALTVYTQRERPWMSSMGADVMVRMGIVYADVLGGLDGQKQFKNMACQMPGYIGDEGHGEQVGRIRVGAAASLTGGDRRYEELR